MHFRKLKRSYVQHMTKCCTGQLQYENTIGYDITIQYDRERVQGMRDSVTPTHPQPHPSLFYI